MTKIELAPQQQEALTEIEQWFNEKSAPWYTLGGYAGTGKTFLVGYFYQHLMERLNRERPKKPPLILQGAYTGKAAHMMRRKGIIGARTIHNLIYTFDDADEKTGELSFHLNQDSDVRYAELLILDECSMISDEVASDLLSFKTPLLVLGDPGQLPPIEGTGYFNDAHYTLTEIHRQVADSPIIKLSMMARNREAIQYGDYGDCKKIRLSELSDDDLLEYDQVLVGTNRTRRTINRQFRHRLGFTEDHPMEGEKVICLKNNHEQGLLNGMMFTVAKFYGPLYGGYSLLLEDEDGNKKKVNAHQSHFNEYHKPGTVKGTSFIDLRDYAEFDYGYAITVHKSQGSQWEKVILFDENFGWKDRALNAKWMYTGITRAAEKLIIVK